jgi:PAS domain S-box-containing protein
MLKDKSKAPKASEIRRRAEKQLAEKQTVSSPQRNDKDTLKLIHELQVQQIQLEMQNEELIQARAEIEASLEKYSDLYDFAPVGYFTLSDDGIIREVNLTGASLLGEERSTLINQHFSMFLSREAHTTFVEFLRKVFEDTTKKTCEVMLAGNKDTPRYMHIEGTAVNAGKGQGWQCRVAVVDITEHKWSEEKLKESEQRFQEMAISIRGVFWLFDWDKRKAIYVSPAYEEIYGRPIKEVYDLTEEWDKNIHPDDRLFVNESFKQVFQKTGPEGASIEYRIIRPDGEVRWISNRVYAVRDPDGKIRHLTGFAADITDFKRSLDDKKCLEVQLAQAQKMEALGTLAGGVAHDFNNILTAIMGYTEIAKLNVAEPEKVRKNLDNLLKSSKRAKDLVSQILSFSRHAAGEHEILTLSYTVQESLNMLKATIPSNIEIKQKLDSHGKVRADPSQINQMMMNLSINAAQAIGVSVGVLEVGLEEVSVDEAVAFVLDVSTGRYLRLTVSDTGQGMPPEVMARIFEPYFTTKNKAGNSGLGLSIVHGIVKRHGGAITCQSKPGEGATFEIYLPEAIAEGEEEVTEPVKVEVPTGNEKILFVDDENALVEVAESLLGSLGYTVTALTSSIEALDLLRKDPDQFDLVVTDMTMPEMMGDKLAQKILEIRPDIPVIMYTGYSEYITEERAKSIGIRRFILKPFEIEDLAKNIRNELDKKENGKK